MSTVATRQAPPEVAPAPAVPGRRRRWTRLILPTYTWLMIFYLRLPVLVMIVFGFNDIQGRLNLRWEGFTLRWYRELFAIPGLTTALRNSLAIAVVSTIISTVLGTMIGLALGRYRFRGKDRWAGQERDGRRLRGHAPPRILREELALGLLVLVP